LNKIKYDLYGSLKLRLPFSKEKPWCQELIGFETLFLIILFIVGFLATHSELKAEIKKIRDELNLKNDRSTDE